MSRRLVVLLATLAMSPAAFAGPASIDAQLFRPPATGGGIFGLDDGGVGPHLSVAASLFIDYAHEPIVLKNASGGRLGALVGDQLDFDLALSIALWKRLEIGLLLPVLIDQSTDAALLSGSGGALAHSGIGDLRLEVKVRLGTVRLGRRSQLGFAVAAGVGFPTGDTNSFYGEDGFTFRPRAMATWHISRLELTLQLGAIVRGRRNVDDLRLGTALSYGVGARVNVWRGLSLSATWAGLANLSGTHDLSTAPMEFLVGPEWRFRRLPFVLLAAAGRGLTDGFGAPDARVIAAVRYQPREPGDRDGDGVLDDVDACPDEFGPRENRGCPDRDRDGDGLIDRLDRCPDQPGPAENGGCPDRDSDGDGLVDRLDSCPTIPGPKENGGCPDKDQDHDGVPDRLDRCRDIPGPAENQGCPWPDRDGDGVLDRDDQCPTVFGLKENHGCPDTDTDGDGIVDRLDKCPTEKEVFNGVDDDDGCPDKGPELATFTPQAIEIKQKIQFEFGKATIKPASFLLLATVAKIMTLHPDVTLIRIEGHTDSVGTRAINMKLSQARAESVRRHLVDVNGIEPQRVTAAGFGPDRPIDSNKTPAGRAKNRRVEFVVVERNGQAPPPKLP